MSAFDPATALLPRHWQPQFGATTLRRARAVVLEVNIDPLYEGQASFRELFGILDELGYHYAGNQEQAVAADGHVIYLDAVFLNPAPTG